MNRKQTTQFLTDILIKQHFPIFTHYAQEVTLDYGTKHSCRIDIMRFEPKGSTFASDIEKGVFTCYEIKSCKADVYSGNGLNFYGEYNYIVTTMKTYKELKEDIYNGKLNDHVKSVMNVNECPKFGFMVAVPSHLDMRKNSDMYEEYMKPTELKGEVSDWKMWTIIPSYSAKRTKSITELLFCMLRAKCNQVSR